MFMHERDICSWILVLIKNKGIATLETWMWMKKNKKKQKLELHNLKNVQKPI